MVVRKVTAWFLLAAGATFAAELPRKAPDFQINMIDGKKVSLNQYRGKLVVLACISTTCPHCQHYVQILNGIQKEYAARGVQILGAAFNEGVQTALPGFLQQYQPVFPLGWDDHTAVLGLMQISILNPGFVPKVMFIDRTGTIRKQYEGQEEFFKDPDKSTRAALDEMLKAAPAAQRKSGVKTASKR